MVKINVEIDKFSPSLELTMRDCNYGLRLLIPLNLPVWHIKHFEYLIVKKLNNSFK